MPKMASQLGFVLEMMCVYMTNPKVGIIWIHALTSHSKIYVK